MYIVHEYTNHYSHRTSQEQNIVMTHQENIIS